MVIPPAPPPPPPPGPRKVPMVRPGCGSPALPSQQLLGDSSAASSSVGVGQMDYSYVQPVAYGTARSTTNYGQIRGDEQSLPHGRMDVAHQPAPVQLRPARPLSGSVPRPVSRTEIPSPTVDTDLALSLVNETRDSFQLKTRGMRPLSEQHLMSLVNLDSLPNSYTPSPAYSARLHQTPAQPPLEPLRVHTNTYAAPPVSRDPPPRAPSGTPVREFDPDSFCRDLRDASLSSRKAPTPKPSPTFSPQRSPRYFVARPPLIDGDVDSLTQRMIYNMETGEGAAGDYDDARGGSGHFLMSDTESYNCAKCGEGISIERAGCTALNQTYHLDCFICTTCGSRLAGGAFYAVDGKPFCEKDYVDTLEKCTVCNEAIMDRILRASGKAFHPQCFVCVACQKCLDGVPFTVDSNNQVYCVQCFHEKYAPRCAACSKPIVPEEGKEESLRVVAMDKSFHVSCYKCEDCGLKLSSKIEGHGCYPLDGHLYCKSCNADRVRKLTA